MRTMVPVGLACLTLFLVAGTALGQTLQVPAHKTATEPAKGPTAAPRQPLQPSGPAHHPPVVRPQGPVHAQRTAPPAAARPPTPPAVAAAPPPVAPPPAKPADSSPPDPNAPKLPRFAALRSDDVNLRAGPGTRYPIEWVYKRRDLPVEIEREFEVWRAVRDIDGIQGWVHQATLTGRRTFIVQGSDAPLRADAKDTADQVAILKVGVIGRIRSCGGGSDWCDVQVQSYRGYLRRDQIWGVLPNETIAP